MAVQGLAKLFNAGLNPVVKNFKGLTMAKFTGNNGKEFIHLYDDLGNLVSTKVRDGVQITKLNIFKDQWGDKIYQQVVKNSPYGFKNGTTTVRVSDFNDLTSKIEVTKPNGWFGDVTREYFVAKPVSPMSWDSPSWLV